MNAVDTNVLVYTLDTRDPAKQRIARALIEEIESPVLLWQVAVEYLAVSRKLERLAILPAQPWQELARLRRLWPVAFPTWDTMELSRELLARYSLSFWDSLIVAACVHADVSRLYSGDLGAAPRIAGVEIVNPFAAAELRR